LGQASPHFQALTQARAAAYLVWEVIDAVSTQLSLEPIVIFDFLINHLIVIKN
jgi:hypothetical protein